MYTDVRKEKGVMDFTGVNKDQKVFIAMSGGVDSSVTAALLHDHGYNVEGITLLLHEEDLRRGVQSKDCYVQEDVSKVADTLGIKVHFLNCKDLFYDTIIAPFFAGYGKGETPNPCTVCNRDIKFGEMYKQSMRLGADILATGHYIKWLPSEDNSYGKIYKGSHMRDQSYFLALIKKDVLSKIRFPLADYSKEEVRQLARKYNLHIADKKASNDICFTGKFNYNDMINHIKVKHEEGNILDTSGKKIGRHQGIHNFTIGQRKGIGVGGNERPLYVVNVDSKKNEVTVGEREFLQKSSIILNDTNWIGEGDIVENTSKKIYCKVRASQEVIAAEVFFNANNVARVILEKPIYGVAKAQICAFYDNNNRLLGGGIIKEAMN